MSKSLALIGAFYFKEIQDACSVTVFGYVKNFLWLVQKNFNFKCHLRLTKIPYGKVRLWLSFGVSYDYHIARGYYQIINVYFEKSQRSLSRFSYTQTSAEFQYMPKSAEKLSMILFYFCDAYFKLYKAFNN